MSDKTGIEWTDSTWPIVQGCDPVSPGCANCYAVPLLHRLAGNPNAKISAPLQGLTEVHTNAAGKRVLRFTGNVVLREDRLDWPRRWREPRRIFVPSHGDLYHKDVPDSFIDRVHNAMLGARQHTYQILTKRSERMRGYWSRFKPDGQGFVTRDGKSAIAGETVGECVFADHNFPPKGWWLGVSCERQQEADERIPHLLATPAAVRFISAEPLLGPIDLRQYMARDRFYNAVCEYCGYTGSTEHWPLSRGWDDADVVCPKCERISLADEVGKLDWVIVGGESGPAARPMHPDWARKLRDQCVAAGVAFFFKQWGAWAPTSTHPVPDPETGLRKMTVVASSERRRVGETTYWAGRGPGLLPDMLDCVGKARAGRLLDGRAWDEMPTIRPEPGTNREEFA